MMIVLNIVTTLCVGLLIGSEFAVSAFINPVLWQLDDATQYEAIRLFARRLGTAMPFWYVGSLMLLISVAIGRMHQPGFVLLAVAAGVWVAVIVLTLLFLVPINNRLAQMDAVSFTDSARRDHRRWDNMHRVRIAALVVAMVAYLAGSNS